MISFFSKQSKIVPILLSILYLVTPFNFVVSAELNSTSFSLQEYTFGSGDESNSTNFSVIGNVDQVHTGLFSVSNLPLAPGLISSCGKITSSGTYTLENNLIGISGSCFFVEANDVTIDGNGYTVIAGDSNTSYAIVATSTGSGSSGYGTTTIQNITFSGFGSGINANGNNATSGNTNGGNGGAIVITDSNIGSIVANAGLGSGTGIVGNGGYVEVNNSTTGNITTSGTSGSIVLFDDDLSISNKIYTTSGVFSISYTGALTTTNTTISSVSNFIVNGTNYGSYIGGIFPILPGTITSCGTLYFSGTYTFGSNITGNCTVAKTGVIINGVGNTLTGNISAGIYGATLSNIGVTGTVSTTGAGAGILTITNSSNLTGTISVTGQISGDGSSSLSHTTISSGGSVATSSVSFVSDVINNGTIGPNNSVLGKITNNGTINAGVGTFTFNATSTNSGIVNGNAILSASSTNSGTITGTAQFNQFIGVSGAVTISGSTAFAGTGYVNGTVLDSNTSAITSWVFTDSSTNIGVLKGNSVFTGTSQNKNTATVIGNAEFRETSSNLGVVTGNSEVYSPVTRPLGGTTNGLVTYHDYAGLYYHDSAVGHGVTGKWNDINNWWLDSSATVHSPVLPTSGDTVIILSGTISTTTATSSVSTITFKNSSVNGITITVNSSARDAALFNDSSVNNGTIIGNATFAGNNSVHNGTVTGYITRLYSTDIFTVVNDFTHNGVHWIVQAVNGATVDLTGATYSLVTNIFEALTNSIFIWNTFIGGGTPDLVITAPTTGTIIKWQPIIDWDTNTLCQYKFDSGTYTSVDCSLDGFDIPKPTAGAHTLFVKSTDSNGNATEKTISFTYDNTQPIDTDCSTPLDEATRPYYYLSSNVGNCSVTATTTLRGDDGAGNYYTIANITGNNKPIVLQNITSTGVVQGFNSIEVASSTLEGGLVVTGVFNTDIQSSFGSTTISNTGIVNGGRFTSNVTNIGVINIGTTPVTVAGTLNNYGTINGGITLSNSSINYGTIVGNVTLNNSAVNRGTVQGNLIFGTLTAVGGIVTFEDDIVFQGSGTTTGSFYDNQGNIISIWSFKDTSTNLRKVQGTAFFSDSASNLGTVSGNAHFDDNSINSGIVTGNAYRYSAYLAAKILGGTVQGSKIYRSYPNTVAFRNISGDYNWNNVSNWFAYVATTTPLGRIPVSGEDVVLFATTTLKSNVIGNMYIGSNNITINGGGYTVTGNVFGNGSLIGNDAYNFNLLYMIITGSTTAIGGDGYQEVSGGKGGNIDVRYSSTGPIAVNGGDPEHDGGDAGTIYALNSIGIEEDTVIFAYGGDAFVCGYGGSGGNVTLVDTAQYLIASLEPGQDAVTTIAQGGGCNNPPSGSSGRRGQSNQSGTFNPSLNSPNNSGGQDTSSNTDGSRNPSWLDRLLPFVKFKLPDLSELDFKPLPVFGTGLGDMFSFVDRIRNFFTSNAFAQMEERFYSAPGLLSYLKIHSINDVVLLKNNPVRITDTKFMGLFTLYSENQIRPLSSYITADREGNIIQFVRVKPLQNIVVSLIPTVRTSEYTAVFDQKDITFKNNTFEFVAPEKPGTYILSTYASPVVLHIEVIDQNIFDQTKNSWFFIILNTIIKTVKNFFSCILFGC